MVAAEARAGHGPSLEPGEGEEGVTEEELDKEMFGPKKKVAGAVHIGEFECTECNKRFVVEHWPDGTHKLRQVREVDEE